MTRATIIAHRGASGLRPENTLAAFERAIQLGSDGIEFDIQLTADGIIVVHHDYNVSTDWARRDGTWLKEPGPKIRELTLKEVKSFDIGRLSPRSKYNARYPWYQPADGATIPTLREVLDLVKTTAPEQFQLWIELKVNPDSENWLFKPAVLAQRTIIELKAARLLRQATIISFYWPALYHVLQIDRSVKTGFLSSEQVWLNNIRPSRKGPSHWTAPSDIRDYDGSVVQMIKSRGGSVWSVYWRDLTQDRLGEAQKKGIKVGVWTIRKHSEIDKVLKLGVNFITTDRPDWFIKFHENFFDRSH